MRLDDGAIDWQLPRLIAGRTLLARIATRSGQT